MNPGDFDRRAFFEKVQTILADRGDEYTDPRPLFEEIAARWTATTGLNIAPQQVVLCMLDLKIARLSVNWSHADSIADLAGYAAILAELNHTRKDAQ